MGSCLSLGHAPHPALRPRLLAHHNVVEAGLALGHALFAAVKEGADGQPRRRLLITLTEKLLL